MKKPILIYLIAVWAFFQEPFYISTPVGIISKIIEISPDSTRLFKGFGYLAAFIVLIGLIQLKRMPRLITRVFLIIALIVTLKIFMTLLLMEKQLSPITYISFPLIILGDALCLWYLFRKSFVDLSIEYRKQIEMYKNIKPPKVKA